MAEQECANGITDANINQINKEQNMNIKNNANSDVNLFKINTLQIENEPQHFEIASKGLSETQIKTNYFKGAMAVHLVGKDRLNEYVRNITFHGEISKAELGKEHLESYSYGISEYYEEFDENFFWEYCDHDGIEDDLTEDSTDEEFKKYIDFERLGMDLIDYCEGCFGEEFYEMEGQIFEIASYDILDDYANYDEYISQIQDSMDIPDIIESCYISVYLYLNMGYALNEAIQTTYNDFSQEVA